MLKVNNLSGGYGGKTVVKNMTFHVEKGRILGILGPNGSGKSTLLKMISGVLKCETGEILIEEKPLKSYDNKQLAKKMAVLPQLNASAFTNSVYDAVSLGRYPHQSGFFHLGLKKMKRRYSGRWKAQVFRNIKINTWSFYPAASSNGYLLHRHLHKIRSCFYWMNRQTIWISPIKSRFWI